MASACALAIVSGKIIYNFAILENLRIFQNCLFTGGVVEENGICSAAFCESVALRAYPFRHRLRRCHLPQGDGFSSSGKVSGSVQRRPLGGAAERSEAEGVLREFNRKKITERPQTFRYAEMYNDF